jgi:hypothetical protein
LAELYSGAAFRIDTATLHPPPYLNDKRNTASTSIPTTTKYRMHRILYSEALDGIARGLAQTSKLLKKILTEDAVLEVLIQVQATWLGPYELLTIEIPCLIVRHAEQAYLFTGEKQCVP